MSGYVSIKEKSPQEEGRGHNEPRETSPGRIELTAVSGMRFFATLFLVCGRSIETLWIDSGSEAKFLSVTLCSGLHLGAKDVVSFYYVLSGFTLAWGYGNRDLDSSEVRWRYWTRRFVRFYPDFAISTIVTFLLKQPFFFGCHDYGWPSWVSQGTSLLLFTAWYRFIPGSGYINGPVWFIVTLFWLWIFFPYLFGASKKVFENVSWSTFLLKMLALWVISLVPWAFIDESNVDTLRWALRCFPILRIPEFVCGIALALRVRRDKDELRLYGSSDSEFHPRSFVGFAPLICVFFALFYYAYSIYLWPEDCTCLDSRYFHCFGWIEAFDTKFLPLSAIVIYSVTTLDVCAHDNGTAEFDNVKKHVGVVGAYLWSFFCLDFFVMVGKWGLPIFLWQAAVNVLVEAFLVDVHWGLESRCTPQSFTLAYAVFYWIFHLLSAYVVAYLMYEEGPVGRLIHSGVAYFVKDS
ncbi:hypothetical protein GUITHDRAFT_107472 [Guillardia theta CCMP2712]|uniref:Acyltransferase 3 domain-containing protein n=1 Tax=Guillardia theta (strain CCMP2712) TaxID=905079 RepID=L1JF14_GUITC|nr:hypothetical protein GUITHDRAFT_107472 [Guillardia theta CCMP2712]EKX46690.1 hypothetical protein GUITHDRAFT_107472 [Guillardia theta CCMP2712]|eukprot:XP_005833670.1 hypothetical protein GUITHDRAFT_107472 [Guillardia theta CCMP2712]